MTFPFNKGLLEGTVNIWLLDSTSIPSDSQNVYHMKWLLSHNIIHIKIKFQLKRIQQKQAK